MRRHNQDLPGRSCVRAARDDARVSIIVKFFVAPDDTAATSTLRTGPGPALESLSFGNDPGSDAPVPQLSQYGAITKSPITRSPTWAASHGARSASTCLTWTKTV